MSENIFDVTNSKTTLDFRVYLSEFEIQALAKYNPSAFAIEDDEIESLGEAYFCY